MSFREDGAAALDWAARYLERVNRSGEAFISHTRLEGRFVLRLAVGNDRTTESDVSRAWDALRAAAAG